MNELLLAALSGATVWFGLAGIGRKDPVVAGRIAALAGIHSGPASAGHLSSLLCFIGRRFPGQAGETNRGLLASAGTSWPVELLRGVQLLLASLGFLLGLVFGTMAVVMAPAGALVGYRIPPPF